MFYCSTIRCSTVPPSLFQWSTMSVRLFHYQMFYYSTIRCSTVPPSLFNCSTIRWSTIPPSLFYCSTISVPYSTIAAPLFHHAIIYCSTLPDISGVLRFHNEMFHSSAISVPSLLHHHMFYCSPIRWSTVPPRLFNCSTIRCSTAPQSDALLFLH